MDIMPLSAAQRQKRQYIAAQIATLQDQGLCPTCAALQGQDVYPPLAGRAYFDNEFCQCMLEQYPRNPGHSIVLLKPHYEDLADLEPKTAALLWPIVHRALLALKTHLGAEKVYLCTMCDGRRNHLHFQLIPRLPGDSTRGSRLFVKERGLLTNFAADTDALKTLMQGE